MERGGKEGLTPLQKEKRIDVARFLMKERIPADATPKERYDFLGWLDEAAYEGKDAQKLRLANISYTRAVTRMIRRGWTNETDLDLIAHGLGYFLEP